MKRKLGVFDVARLATAALALLGCNGTSAETDGEGRPSACGAACLGLTRLASLQSFFDVATDGSNVFYSGWSVFRRVSVDGGEATDIIDWTGWPEAQRALPVLFAVDATHVYWTMSGLSSTTGGYTATLVRVAVGGGTPETIAVADVDANDTVVSVNDRFAFWTSRTGLASPAQPAVILRAAKLPGTATGEVIATAPEGFEYRDIDSDASFVYAASFSSTQGSGAISRIPVEGGEVETLAALTAMPTAVASNATYVYWIIGGGCADCPPTPGTDPSTGERGTVMRVPVAGGIVERIAGAQTSPETIAVSEAGAFWTTLGDGGPLGGTVVRQTLDAVGNLLGGPVVVADEQNHSANLSRRSAIAANATGPFWVAEAAVMTFDERTCQASRCDCRADENDCGGICVNTRSDDLHCGACGNNCGSNRMCEDGACRDLPAEVE